MALVRNTVREENKAQEAIRSATFDKNEVVNFVKRAGGGDLEAFGELYSIYLDKIYRYIFYQVRDKMTAEDITEEVFVKAWKAIKSCKGKEQTFSSWLYRIAHNHVIDYFRTRRQHLALEEAMPAAIGSPEQEAEEKLMQQELAEAISYLPPQQKQIIILKFIEGLDNQEIAQILRKRQGAIRVMQMRALMALRQRLTSEDTECKLSYLKPLMKV